MAANKDGSIHCSTISSAIFEPVYRQSGVLKRRKVRFGASGDTTKSAEISIHVEGSEVDYTDLSDHALEVTC